MKKTIKLAVVAALALGATSAFATNGDVMIGQGAKSRSMGGVGIAKAFGAESALANPANISSVKDSEATLAVTVFMPSVSFTSDLATTPGSVADSASNLSVIPEIYYAKRLSDKLVLGLAIAGTAGMGVDYDADGSATGSTSGTFRMKTALSLLKVAVPVSYTVGGLTVGLEGVLQYGSLQISHQAQGAPNGFRDNGASSDIGYGLEAGATYTTDGLTLGAVYKSKIGMTYENTISASIGDFGQTNNITSGDNLDQPAEIGIGISYTMGESTISADFKNIAWGEAAGYKDFGWENQDVYAIGYEYDAKAWAVRLGYNYAQSPIVEQAITGNGEGSTKNFFNLAGFPGIVETHYTLGGAYSVSEALTLDAAFIYVPETTNTYNVSELNQQPTAEFATVKHSQMGVTIAGTYAF
ncbi:outer membrane protein transport protein [Sulfurimonas sp. SAG-AH-194-C20]|nr:outer membrane protein transport protein [Sulfurimonas sp. SAG-AH-194-C20]MDF1878015.1 outer membrane protein transport protein [Sulfurimonas sp. SAG-AH-194-C20]